MTQALYFIYDSHCPWSYATTPLVNALQQAFPDMAINLLHAAHYIGKDCAGEQQVNAVKKVSRVKFTDEHMRYVNSPKNSVKTANLMKWLQNKQPEKQLAVLNALQQAHFTQGNPLEGKHNFNDIVSQFKLSPSNKIFKDELSVDAEITLGDIAEIQQMIGTQHFPALIMTQDDNAIFIDHSKYLNDPQAVVEAVKQELAAF
ncbi:protein-disulfide isomerase [Shewanella sp. Scap07]|uniref:protein-disulfide isomerase n=1 Tax=Shewanella sp. Scap07 TaxID=2589987 RepID=UPI0015B8C88F|nr:protein-disulfide isomerase [Shewanella sp. Scap07]QLE84094.1 protein-disulfide isomerase [Shewanella sp. Scap07]